MKRHHSTISLNMSFEDIEKQLARDLGLSCDLETLRKATASMPRAQRQQQRSPVSEREAMEQMFAGKSMSESLALYRANKDRVRSFLGLTPAKVSGKAASKPGSRFVHRSYK
ncbi:MAG: hypothetical protein WDM96_12295 [Lacunisphaera sp.]